MKNKLFQMTWLTMLIAISLTSYGQALTDPCGCNAVLVDGIFSYRAQNGDYEALRVSKNFVCTASYEEYQKSFSAGGGASFLGFGINGGMTDTEFSQRQIQSCTTSETYDKARNVNVLLEKFGDANVLSAWTACKRDCNSGGIKAWIEIRDKNNFELHVLYVQDQGYVNKVRESKIKGGSVSGMTGDKVFDKGYPIPTSETIRTISRTNPQNSVTLTVNVEGIGGGTLRKSYDFAEFIPKWIEPIYNGPNLLTDEVPLEIAYIDQGENPAENRYLFTDGITPYLFKSKGGKLEWGKEIVSVNWLPYRPMPPNGQSGYLGYFFLTQPAEKNQIIINAALLPFAGVIKGKLIVVYRP